MSNLYTSSHWPLLLIEDGNSHASGLLYTWEWTKMIGDEVMWDTHTTSTTPTH